MGALQQLAFNRDISFDLSKNQGLAYEVNVIFAHELIPLLLLMHF